MLLGVMFGIIYAIAVVLLPGGTFVSYALLASFFLFIQYWFCLEGYDCQEGLNEK